MMTEHRHSTFYRERQKRNGQFVSAAFLPAVVLSAVLALSGCAGSGSTPSQDRAQGTIQGAADSDDSAENQANAMADTASDTAPGDSEDSLSDPADTAGKTTNAQDTEGSDPDQTSAKEAADSDTAADSAGSDKTTEDTGSAGADDNTKDAASHGTPLEVPDGQYLSELTGLPISEDLQNQRPIAVMVDNESKALPHYGTADADIVYEMMNSTANDRITRLMCIYKDWGSITKVGSIRSVRPTNILVAQEYDAVLCHDGGPYYINDYFSRYPYHFSGTFSRVNNGKAREFTEYILSGDLSRNFARSKYSTDYEEDSEATEGHFRFADYGTTVDLDDYDADGVRTANTIELPFYHNRSQLRYNEETETYDYYEYGSQHLDADTKAPLTFENVLLQDCSFHQYDSNGYLIYNCIDRFRFAYYCTKGQNISILWTKETESGITRFYDSEGNEIAINPGKTYIGIIPDDSWDEVMIY